MPLVDVWGPSQTSIDRSAARINRPRTSMGRVDLHGSMDDGTTRDSGLRVNGNLRRFSRSAGNTDIQSGSCRCSGTLPAVLHSPRPLKSALHQCSCLVAMFSVRLPRSLSSHSSTGFACLSVTCISNRHQRILFLRCCDVPIHCLS